MVVDKFYKGLHFALVVSLWLYVVCSILYMKQCSNCIEMILFLTDGLFKKKQLVIQSYSPELLGSLF